ncbi:MAG: YHS domain-containing (seleno)protein [Kofleriaceae bacterium]
MRTIQLLVLVAALGCGGAAKPAATPAGPIEPAARTLVNVDERGVGLGGHDPVAYVTDNAPVAGVTEHASQHAGASYQFATAEHKATFEAARNKHAPQYGGYCAFAASQNRLSPSDPKVFLVMDGQLLVFTNQDFLDQFNKDPAGNKAKADQHWPGLVAEHGK